MHVQFEDAAAPLHALPDLGLKKYIIFILNFIYKFLVPRESQHCHIPMLTLLYLSLHTRARADDAQCIHHDRHGLFLHSCL